MAELGAESSTPLPPPTESSSTGLEEKLNGIDCYINWHQGCTKAIVMATDAFGWRRPKMRRLADKTAAVGFVTVVPDYLQDDPLDSGEYDSEGSLNIEKWRENHPIEASHDLFLGIIKALKEKGITSVGMAGFSHGAMLATLAAKVGVLDAVVILHPSQVPVGMMKGVKVPLAILAAQKVRLVGNELMDAYERYLLSQNKIEFTLKLFQGVGHGFSVRYDEKDSNALRCAIVAHMDMIHWFRKHLKENVGPFWDPESSNLRKGNIAGASLDPKSSHLTKDIAGPSSASKSSYLTKDNVAGPSSDPEFS